MDTDRLNRWLTLAANIGVIAGILFLALELRQNSNLMRAQSRTEMSKSTVELLTLHINDESYVDAMYRGLRGEELTELEKEQFHRTYAAWTQHWNNVAYLHDEGHYDDAAFELQMKVVRDELEYLPGWKTFWCETREWNANPAVIEAIEGSSDGRFCGQ